MMDQTSQPGDTRAADEQAVRDLYTRLLAGWNERNASAFAALFAEESTVVGFDGSMMHGPAEIEASLRQIFADHQTAAYLGKIKQTRVLAPSVALLRAVAGMVPAEQADLNPAVNTIQTLVAVKQAAAWRIALYQNTPAQFHGRPELAQQLTDELRQVLTTTRAAT